MKVLHQYKNKKNYSLKMTIFSLASQFKRTQVRVPVIVLSGNNLVQAVCIHVPLSPTLLLQPFNGLFSRTIRVSRYQKGKTNLDFTGAKDSEWHWHQLGHKQVCTSLQTDNHASTPPLCFLQAGCPSCRPTNRVKALKAPGSIIWYQSRGSDALRL